MRLHKLALLCVLPAIVAGFPVLAADEDRVVMERVSGQVYMLSGGGGANISVLAGDGSALMVDSKGPAVAEQIRSHVRNVSGGEVQYLINGHEHPDHTDGNAGFGETGSIIIAHEDVLEVLAAGQRGGSPAPVAARPVITIPDGGEMTLFFAGETVHIAHAPAAHSTGNILVYYENANVLHLGDLYGPVRYPVIAGGTIDGFIAANRMALALANDDTKVIAGIGPLADISQVQDYLDMLLAVRERVAALVAQGSTLDDVMAANVTAPFDATWGDPARFIPAVYDNLRQGAQ